MTHFLAAEADGPEGGGYHTTTTTNLLLLSSSCQKTTQLFTNVDRHEQTTRPTGCFREK